LYLFAAQAASLHLQHAVHAACHDSSSRIDAALQQLHSAMMASIFVPVLLRDACYI
jgi:hypothetical protein